jgi:hypothetical protein
MTAEELAKQMVASHGGLWDALEEDCGNPKNCPDRMPAKMHKRYWLELAAKKLRIN